MIIKVRSAPRRSSSTGEAIGVVWGSSETATVLAGVSIRGDQAPAEGLEAKKVLGEPGPDK